jgi:hypothetical protein
MQDTGFSYDDRDLLDDNGTTGCPQRVFIDGMGGFLIGLIGGGTYWLFRARRLAINQWEKGGPLSNLVLPPKIPKRIISYYRLHFLLKHGVRIFGRKYAKLAFTFGLWGFLFSAYDCFILAVRQHAHPLNHLAAGFLTGATIALRRGTWRRILLNGALGAILMGGFEIMFRGQSLWQGETDEPDPLVGLSEQEKIRYISEDPNFEKMIEAWEEILDMPEPEEYPVMTLRDWEKMVYLYPTNYPPWKDIPPGEPNPIPSQWIPPPSYYRYNK